MTPEGLWSRSQDPALRVRQAPDPEPADWPGLLCPFGPGSPGALARPCSTPATMQPGPLTPPCPPQSPRWCPAERVCLGVLAPAPPRSILPRTPSAPQLGLPQGIWGLSPQTCFVLEGD